MKRADLIFSGILVLGGIGHAFGSYYAYKDTPMTLLWALSGSLALLLLASINLLRVARPGDKALAWICFFGNVAWIAACVAFARITGSAFDIRPDLHGLAALALALFSLKSAFTGRRLPA